MHYVAYKLIQRALRVLHPQCTERMPLAMTSGADGSLHFRFAPEGGEPVTRTVSSLLGPLERSTVVQLKAEIAQLDLLRNELIGIVSEAIARRQNQVGNLEHAIRRSGEVAP